MSEHMNRILDIIKPIFRMRLPDCQTVRTVPYSVSVAKLRKRFDKGNIL